MGAVFIYFVCYYTGYGRMLSMMDVNEHGLQYALVATWFAAKLITEKIEI